MKDLEKSTGSNLYYTPDTSMTYDDKRMRKVREFIGEGTHPQIQTARETLSNVNGETKERLLRRTERYSEYACFSIGTIKNPNFEVVRNHLYKLWVSVNESLSASDIDIELFEGLLAARQQFATAETIKSPDEIYQKNILLDSVVHQSAESLGILEAHALEFPNELLLTRVSCMQLFAQASRDLIDVPGNSQGRNVAIKLLSDADNILSDYPKDAPLQRAHAALSDEVKYFLSLYKEEAESEILEKERARLAENAI